MHKCRYEMLCQRKLLVPWGCSSGKMLWRHWLRYVHHKQMCRTQTRKSRWLVSQPKQNNEEDVNISTTSQPASEAKWSKRTWSFDLYDLFQSPPALIFVLQLSLCLSLTVTVKVKDGFLCFKQCDFCSPYCHWVCISFSPD